MLLCIELDNISYQESETSPGSPPVQISTDSSELCAAADEDDYILTSLHLHCKCETEKPV